MANLKLNRQQLAQFLPNHEAIKAFEALFLNTYETIPTDLESVQASADTAQVQAAEALSSLAQIANALSLALYGSYNEAVTQDNFVSIAEQVKEDSYIPPISLGSIAEQNANKVAISGGAIDNTPIGLNTAAAAAFTALAASGLISANGGQIKFPATQAPSADPNTLDDYEEGTWTPAFSISGGGSMTFTIIEAKYVKIGRLVFCMFAASRNDATASVGAVTWSLPFASDGTAAWFPCGVYSLNGANNSGVVLVDNYANNIANGHNTAAGADLTYSVLANTFRINVSMTYMTS